MSFVRGFISTYNKVFSWLGSVNLRYSGKFIIKEYIKRENSCSLISRIIGLLFNDHCFAYRIVWILRVLL